MKELCLAALVALSCAACRKPSSAIPLTSAEVPPILLFNGSGTSPNDVAAVEAILDANQLRYSTADSAQLNEMSEARLRSYGLLILPGGNFITMGDGLTTSTTAKIHDAVQSGMSYLGICAGAFLAGHYTTNHSINLASGVKFAFYSDESRGLRKSTVAITTVGSPALDQYWEDGPQLDGWGTVVGKYPDGTAAIVEGASGAGWVVLSGVHPEAPENWRRGMTFSTPATVDHAYAATLIQAALHRTSLPHF